MGDSTGAAHGACDDRVQAGLYRAGQLLRNGQTGNLITSALSLHCMTSLEAACTLGRKMGLKPAPYATITYFEDPV